MPNLWNDTVEAHRRGVRDAVLEAMVGLVAEHGLRSITMSQIAERAGIGRATLYKYFSDVEAVLLAWHQRQVSGHLQQLAEVAHHAGNAGERLQSVLEAYALIAHHPQGHHDAELSAFLHRSRQVAEARRQLRDWISELISQAAETRFVRDDVPADELAIYCLHALDAARNMESEAAARRLVAVATAGLRSRS